MENDKSLARSAQDILSSYNKLDSIRIKKQRSQMTKQISVFDIFSGTIIDNDILPIEENLEHEAVYGQVDSAQQPFQPIKSVTISDTEVVDSQLADKRKSPSFVHTKFTSKKNHKNVLDKENDGVITRMKKQELFYDGRKKYKSLLPEMPIHLAGEHERGHRSLNTPAELEEALYTVSKDSIYNTKDTDGSTSRNQSFTEVNNNNMDKKSQEEDDNDVELELNGECNSNSKVKLSRLISEGPQRIKWVETEEGMKLVQSKNLTSDIIKWQEAQFEVITSEASYYRSLQILVNKIYKSPYMLCQGEKQESFSETELGESGGPLTTAITPLMTPLQKHHLFSNILEIHICSGDLLKALETRWRKTPFIEDLSDILIDFSKEKLRPYITYLRNQQYQTSTYNQLLTSPEFQNVINKIETDLDCGMLNLSSFLLLPMQRMLRLKLLFVVIKHYIPPGYPVQGCDEALACLDGLIKQCSDEKVLMEQKEEIMKIYNRLSFKKQTGVSIGNKPLLKNGSLKISASNSKASRSLNSSCINRTNKKAQLYLFEDQLIIAKRKRLPLCLSSNDSREMVVDICPRSSVTFDNCASRSHFSVKSSINDFKLILDQGLKGCAEYTCEADSKEILEEWQNIFSTESNEWEEFEFNDVLVLKDFKSTGIKELDLKRGQILTIIKKINDERAIASSGEKKGEIPLSHVQFVSSPQSDPELITEIRRTSRYKK